jgi:hypothetical protein
MLEMVIASVEPTSKNYNPDKPLVGIFFVDGNQVPELNQFFKDKEEAIAHLASIQ